MQRALAKSLTETASASNGEHRPDLLLPQSSHFLLLQQCVPEIFATTTVLTLARHRSPDLPPHHPVDRTQHSKYELNDIRRRCEEL